MTEQGAQLASPLAARLFAAQADLAERRALAAVPEAVDAQLAACIVSAPTAQPVMALLERIAAEKLPTLVYGDYDVDGSTSATLLLRWLRQRGVAANYFLPSRFGSGYGLDADTLAKAKGQGYRAVLALDCGTTSIAEIALLRADGIVAAVIDHHTPKDELPDCPLLNPHLDSALPVLCTAGLCYALLAALAARGLYQPLGDEIEIAGLATIADSAELNPPGWALAHHALQRLPATGNAGLSELCKVSGLDGLSILTGRQLSFDLIPRLNAAGRMQHARAVVELLLAGNQADARTRAGEIDRANRERKEVSKQVETEALRQGLEQPYKNGAVLYSERWHPGVLGIIAARAAAHLDCPVIVLAPAPKQGDGQEDCGLLLAGSARSARGVSLIAALDDVAGLLVSHGGHSAAAGVKVRAGLLPELRSAWDAACAAHAGAADALAGSLPEPPAVERATLGELTQQFDDDLWSLAPFGQGFPAPRLRLTGCKVARVSYMGAARTHLNLLLTDGAREARVAAFNMSHLFPQLREGMPVEPLIEAEPDNWNNQIGISLRLLEL